MSSKNKLHTDALRRLIRKEAAIILKTKSILDEAREIALPSGRLLPQDERDQRVFDSADYDAQLNSLLKAYNQGDQSERAIADAIGEELATDPVEWFRLTRD